MVGRLFRRDAFHGGGDCGIERRQVHARHTAVFDHDAAVDHDRIDIRRLAAVDDIRHQIVNGLQMGFLKVHDDQVGQCAPRGPRQFPPSA